MIYLKKIQTLSHSEYESIGVSSLITRIPMMPKLCSYGNILRLGFYDASDVYCQSYMVMRTSPSLECTFVLMIYLKRFKLHIVNMKVLGFLP